MYLSILKATYRKFSTTSLSNRQLLQEEVRKWNSVHNAFISLSKADSFQTDSQNESEPLKGVSIAIKDNICTKDYPTTCGSLILKDYCPEEDATVVKKLKDRGAVIMGKTNLDEFGMGSSNQNSFFGAAFNPHPSFPDKQHVPGGSSGGSAAAVAAELCYGALGTDTGGSVRLPASYCGVVGFKPSYGRISRLGLVSYASSLDTVGILAKDVKRASHLFEAIEGADPLDQTSRHVFRSKSDFMWPTSLAGAKIGIPRECFLAELDPQIIQAWRDCIRQLKKAGAILGSVSLPHTNYALPAYYVIALSEASSNLSRYDGVRFGHQASDPKTFSGLLTQTREEGFGAEVKRRILLGTYALTSEAIDDYYYQAQKVRRLVKQDFDTVFSSHDFILTPTAIGLSPNIDQSQPKNSAAAYLNDVFTVPASLAGIPAISFPWNSPKESPVGLQLIAKFDRDRELLNFAHLLSQAFPNNK